LAAIALVVITTIGLLGMGSEVSITSSNKLLSISLNSIEVYAQTQFEQLGANGYAKIEPSGTQVRGNKVVIRVDLYLNPDDAYYDKTHVYVIDENSPDFLAGYLGKVDKDGIPRDEADYQKWIDGLPRIWQDNPFHTHFLNFSPDATDAEIKVEIERTLDYFYSFHKACWDAGVEFIEEWKRIPIREGTIRAPFVAGSLADKVSSEAKVEDIKGRLPEFDIAKSTTGEFVLPTGHQTIDIGSAAIDRAATFGGYYTFLNLNNPANADGSLDTIEIWAATNLTYTYIGTVFLVSGTTYECRDFENIGNVTAGSKQTFSGLDCDVVTGDFMANRHGNTGTIEKDSTGFAGIRYTSATNYIDTIGEQGNYSTLLDGDAISLYGTGAEAFTGSLTNDPNTKAFGIVAASSTYYADGSAPSNPVGDGDCTFTITNDGASTEDIDMKISDFTGGVGWNIVAGAPGSNEVRITAYYSGQNPASGLVLANTDAEFYDALAASATIKWDFKFETGSSFTDGVAKSATLTLTAVAED
jgi:hypothetical protein